ncbi:MAG: nucleotide exchange factor GrpE [Acidimicrobiia bacterium]|nr:nucleotide exchange factor GrpE [Acidimicrobiia bacterium]
MTDNNTINDGASEPVTQVAKGSAEIEEVPNEPTAAALGLTLPDDAHEAQLILLRELVEAREEAGELLENLQRVAAEFDNHRKRTERDQVENVQRASQRVIESLLPVLDSLDAALTIEATSETEARMLEGMRGTQSLILDTLAREGFAPIDAVGTPFDPALHEAVSVNPGEGDQVVEQELRKGYVMRGRVIRPSLVIVGHA